MSRPTRAAAAAAGDAADRPGVLRRLWNAVTFRSLENPATSVADPAQWLMEALGGGPSSSGPAVSESSAITLSAVWACVRILSETLGSLPCSIYERKEPRGSREAFEHPLHELLTRSPNPQSSVMVYRETGQAHLSLWGNSYSEIVRDGEGRPVELWPLQPQGVSVWRKSGVRQYKFQPPNGSPVPLDHTQVLHVPGLGFDGIKGKAPLQIAKESIGEGLATQEFGGRFYSNGVNAGGVLEHPGELDDDAYKRLQLSIAAMQAGVQNAHKPWILEEGMKWHQTTIPPETAQFLQTRKFKVNDIARFFNVPPHLIGDLERATFSNIEQQAIGFVIYCIRPWCVRWEQEMERQLLLPDERGRYFIRFNLAGLLRGDTAGRATFYKEMFNIGVMTQNEIREKEDLPPMEGGDRLYVPLNMVDSSAATGAADRTGGAGGGKGKPPAPASTTSPTKRQLAPVIRDTLERIQRRELEVLGRAAKRPGAAEFLNSFFDGHRHYVQRQLEPIAAVCGFDAAAAADRYATRCQRELSEAAHAGVLEQRLASWAQSDFDLITETTDQ